MKAVILARVSSKEQEEGYSLDAQKDRLVNYCNRYNLEIIKTFTIIESSTQGTRKNFNEMLNFCKTQKSTIAVVADAVDRIQRSFKESISLNELIEKRKIELHFYREGMVINDKSRSTDIMRWDFSVMGAKSYVLQLSENVKRSIDYKLKKGEWIGEAPIGYINYRNEEGKSQIIPDPERANIIKELFNQYGTGLHSISTLATLSNKIGLKGKRSGKIMSATNIHRMLSNPFYYGEMLCKGQLYHHNYTPLISKELFDTCQNILHGRHPNKQLKKQHAFQGLIKCGQCGCSITSDTKVKPSGKTFTYLFCSHYKGNCTNKRVNENIIWEQVLPIFAKLKLPQGFAPFVKEHIENSINAENEFHIQQIKELRQQYDRIQEKLTKIRMQFADEKIAVDDFNAISTQLKSEQYNIEEKLKGHTMADEKFSIAVSTVLSLADNALEYLKSSKVEQKREILNLVLSNLELNDGKLSYTVNSPFNLLLDSSNHNVWRTRRDSNPRPLASEANTLSN